MSTHEPLHLSCDISAADARKLLEHIDAGNLDAVLNPLSLSEFRRAVQRVAFPVMPQKPFRS